MTTPVRTLWLGCLAALTCSGAAYAQEACKVYTVIEGDNLRFIARSAYGDPDLYRVIYNANVDVIGAKADLIVTGARLQIPCDPRGTETAAATATVTESPAATSTGLQTGVVDPAKQPFEVVPELPVATVDGQGVVTEAEPIQPSVEVAAAEPQAQPEVTATPATQPAAPVMPAIRLLTGNGYAPFADEMLPGGGMFTQLVEMAIFRADPAIPYNLTFINDWQAHIDALLPSLAYDLSFPWVKPDCEGDTMLSAGDQARCDNFQFSVPLYEVVDGFFAPADSELVNVTKYTGFEGKRICRPEGYTTGVLEAAGLTPPKVELLRPSSVTDCFEALADGEVDLVSIDAEVGDSAIAELGLVGDFTQNPHLMTLQSLHVIAHKSNARAIRMVRMIDEGVAEMYESGEWYDIVSSALARGAMQQ